MKKFLTLQCRSLLLLANESPDQINIRKGLFHYPLIIIISERSSIYSLYFSGLST